MDNLASEEGWSRHFEKAAFDPQCWPEVLQRLADQTGSARAQLIGVGERAVPFNWITGMDGTTLAELAKLAENGGYSANTNYRIAASDTIRSVPVIYEAHYDDIRPRLEDDCYVEFCDRHDLPFGCQSIIGEGSGHIVGMATLRTNGDGRTRERDRRIFGAAVRAARTAVRLQIAIEREGAMLLNGALGSMSSACLLIGDGHRVLALTGASDNLLARPDCPIRCKDKLISAVEPRATRAVVQALARVTVPHGDSHRRIALSGVRPDSRPPGGADGAGMWRIDFFRLGLREWSIGFLPRAAIILQPPAAATEPAGSATALLVEIFGLTRAEAAIAALIGQGVDRAQIGRMRGISHETLRVHLKNIYSKIGCNREAELALIISRFQG